MMQQTQGHDNGFVNSQAIEHLAYGPPPGLAYPPGLMAGPGLQGQAGRGYDLMQAAGSAHGEFHVPFYTGKHQARVPSAVASMKKYYNRP